jgi:hypothetical protein
MEFLRNAQLSCLPVLAGKRKSQCVENLLVIYIRWAMSYNSWKILQEELESHPIVHMGSIHSGFGYIV